MNDVLNRISNLEQKLTNALEIIESLVQKIEFLEEYISKMQLKP